MLRLLEPRFRPARIAALILAGVTAILFSRARHIAAQSPPVSFKSAPELVGSAWLNSDKPITLASRRGKVTMVEFWTFMCSNCLANLPAYEKWQARYSARGFTIIGIHSPELKAEHDLAKVKAFIRKNGVSYPVLFDGDYKNWTRWKQECWPTLYLIDKQGRVRFVWVGELDSMGSGGAEKVQSQIETLLDE
jgi:thiol-disulfide isomerase/thioredoxin